LKSCKPEAQASEFLKLKVEGRTQYKPEAQASEFLKLRVEGRTQYKPEAQAREFLKLKVARVLFIRKFGKPKMPQHVLPFHWNNHSCYFR